MYSYYICLVRNSFLLVLITNKEKKCIFTIFVRCEIRFIGLNNKQQKIHIYYICLLRKLFLLVLITNKQTKNTYLLRLLGVEFVLLVWIINKQTNKRNIFIMFVRCEISFIGPNKNKQTKYTYLFKYLFFIIFFKRWKYIFYIHIII